MSTEESTPQASTEPTRNQSKARRRKLTAAIVAGVLLLTGTSFAASMAGAAMAGDKGPDGPPAGSVQTECPDSPPAGMGSS